MQLTRRALWLLLPTALCLAAGAWWSWAPLIALAWLLICGAVLMADWRMTPDPRAWSLSRHHDERLSLAAPNRVAVLVTRRGNGPALPVFLRDDIPPSFGWEGDQRILTGVSVPGQPLELIYTVRPPRRGDYRFGDLHLRWRSTLGFLLRQATFPAAAPVKVYPNLVDVRKYDLLLRRNRLWELGLRATRLLGRGSEFERLRDYSPDDDYRRINWQATARRGKPISVEFETERSQTVIALLDTGRMMRSPVGEVAKLDYAINAVLLLTYVAAQKGDRVGLLAFADKPHTWVAPRGGKVQFHRLLAQLYAVESQPVEPDYTAAIAYVATKQAKRSLVLLFSDLTGALYTQTLAAQLAHLQRRHLVLLVTLRDPTVQALARQPVDDSAALYGRTVAERLLEERQVTLGQLQRQGVLTLDVPADELSIAVINRYLELKAREAI
jgi:uncharacterized protein (DUF58 family)